MNDYEQNKSGEEPKVVEKIKMHLDNSNDNTPVKFNTGAINNDQVEIELQDNDHNVVNHEKMDDPNDPQIILTNQDEIPTDGNLNAPATDRKLMNDINTANNQQTDLSEPKGTEFPQKDGDEYLERKAGKCRPCLVIMRKLILYIGALVSFLNFTADQLYFFKAPFFSHWMWPMIFFLCARILICIGLACIWMQRNKEQRSNIVEQNMTFMMVVLEFFSDFGGMPIIIMFGLYRVLPIKHFSREIKMGYAIEVCTSLIPIFLICLMNNIENPKELTWLVTTQFTLRLYAIVNFGFEIIIVVKQIIHNTYERKRNNPTYQVKTMEQKIQSYGKRLAKYTIVSIVLTIVLLVLGLGLIDWRSCDGKGNMLYWGVCTPCSDDKCLDCWHGPNTCSACKEGYHADKLTGKCLTCSKNEFEGSCKLCKHPNDQGVAECLQCNEGFHMDKSTKQCVKCEDTTGIPNCATCSGTECSGCAPEYFFQTVEVYQTCAKCSGTFEFCDHCSDSKCTKCQENIAKFDSSGSCRECTAPWQKVENGWPHCQCPHIIDIDDNYLCKTCDQVIPGCTKCEYAEELGHHNLGKKVGWDTLLSGHVPNYVGPDKALSPQWVVCTEGDNFKAVNVVINQTHYELKALDRGDKEAVQEAITAGLVLPQTIEVVRQCDSIINKCSECNLDNTEVTCKNCQSGYYIDQDLNKNLMYAVTTRNKCKTCSEFSEHCDECNKYNGCTKCADTYMTMDGQKGCFKCMYDFQCD